MLALRIRSASTLEKADVWHLIPLLLCRCPRVKWRHIVRSGGDSGGIVALLLGLNSGKFRGASFLELLLSAHILIVHTD